jgi:phage baseplate assembly protein V
MERAMARMLAPYARRIGNLLSRGVVAASSAATKMQTLQARLLADEIKDGLEHFEAYGFTSNPLPGAEVVAAFLDGDRSNGVILVAADRRYRITGLQAGEVAIYTDEGDTITLKRGGVVEIDTQTLVVKASTKVTFETPLLETTGKIEAVGDIVSSGGNVADSTGKTMASMRVTYNGHTHTDPQGGTTGTPSASM